jgi:hypothetical protein
MNCKYDWPFRLTSASPKWPTVFTGAPILTSPIRAKINKSDSFSHNKSLTSIFFSRKINQVSHFKSTLIPHHLNQFFAISGRANAVQLTDCRSACVFCTRLGGYIIHMRDSAPPPTPSAPRRNRVSLILLRRVALRVLLHAALYHFCISARATENTRSYRRFCPSLMYALKLISRSPRESKN